MLPLFPLDGFSVVYGLLPWRQAQAFARLRPYGDDYPNVHYFSAQPAKHPEPGLLVYRNSFLRYILTCGSQSLWV